MLRYAALALLASRRAHFQARIDGLEGFADLTTPQENIQRAVREFRNPDVESPRKATAVALGEKLKTKAPPPPATRVSRCSTATASRARRPARATCSPSAAIQMLSRPTASRRTRRASTTSARSLLRRRRGRAPSRPRRSSPACSARRTSKKLTPPVRPLGNDAMLVDRRRPDVPRPARCRARRPDAAAAGGGRHVRRERGRRPAAPSTGSEVRFPLMVPTKIERSSWIDRELPVRVYSDRPGQGAQGGAAHVPHRARTSTGASR